MNRVGILVTLLLLTSIEGSRRVTVVRMTTETTTTTTTISTNTVCFLLKTEDGVPITPCRRRRQHWIEEPLFLAPRGQVDEDLSQYIIEPKETFQVEPTLLPGAGFNGYSGLNQGGYGSPDPLAKHSVQSSLFVPVSSEHQRFIFGSSLFLRRIWAYLANDQDEHYRHFGLHAQSAPVRRVSVNSSRPLVSNDHPSFYQQNSLYRICLISEFPTDYKMLM